jgi:hypothetical protein
MMLTASPEAGGTTAAVNVTDAPNLTLVEDAFKVSPVAGPRANAGVDTATDNANAAKKAAGLSRTDIRDIVRGVQPNSEHDRLRSVG